MNLQNTNDTPDSSSAGSPLPAAKQEPGRSHPGRKAGWYVLFALAVFLLGFGPMWQKSARLTKELSRANTEYRLQTMQFTLADAALDARRGDYEVARQKVSQFYTLARQELDRGKDSILDAAQQEQLRQLSAQQDDIITLLARGDASSAERLAEIYLVCRKALQKG